jgi:hypothetical protein
MAVDNFDAVDFVGISKTGEVVLTVADHLPWDKDNEHLAILQSKLNLYLDFIQAGQLSEQYPKHVGQPLRIDVACLYKPSRDGTRFLELCRETMEQHGWSLSWSWATKDEAAEVLADSRRPARRRPKATSRREKSGKKRGPRGS